MKQQVTPSAKSEDGEKSSEAAKKRNLTRLLGNSKSLLEMMMALNLK